MPNFLLQIISFNFQFFIIIIIIECNRERLPTMYINYLIIIVFTFFSRLRLISRIVNQEFDYGILLKIKKITHTKKTVFVNKCTHFAFSSFSYVI